MYNENDERYEVSDYDEDIAARKELIEEAKNLPETADWRDAAKLQKRWKRIEYWESAYEEELAQEFDRYIDALYAKRNETLKNNVQEKEELVKEAKGLQNSDNWNEVTEQMNALMNRWKEIGSAGREQDDALWEEFNAARQAFYDRKRKHWESIQSAFKNAHKVKEELIEKAVALKDSSDWKKTSEAYRELMEAWKQAGSAGRDVENELWDKFNEARQAFYDRRNAHYEELHAEQDARYTQKKALVEQAKVIVAASEFTKENTAKMKKFGSDWKEIGACGRDRENEIWSEFRETMDAYFAGLKQWNEQRHQQWRQRLVDARARKVELIQNQKRQIKHMEEEIVGLLGQRAIDDMEDRIAEKEEFIEQLEAEVADLDKTLSEE